MCRFFYFFGVPFVAMFARVVCATLFGLACIVRADEGGLATEKVGYSQEYSKFPK